MAISSLGRKFGEYTAEGIGAFLKTNELEIFVKNLKMNLSNMQVMQHWRLWLQKML